MKDVKSETVILIDGVKISLDRNFYNMLGISQKASTEEVERAAFWNLGNFLYIREKTLKLSELSNNDLKDLFTAYYVLTNEEARTAYDLARETNADIKIEVGKEAIDTSKDFYEILNVEEECTIEDFEDAFLEELGSIFVSDANRLGIIGLLSDSDKIALKDIEDAYKILGTEDNREAYDTFLKKFSSKVKVAKVEKSEKAKKSAKNGRNKFKKTPIAVAVALILAGVIALSTIPKLFGDKDKSNDFNDPSNPYESSQSVDDSYQAPKGTYNNPNNDEEVQKRANEIFNQINANGVSLEIFDEKVQGSRALSVEDIQGLLYWCSFMELDEQHASKACDMDTAAMIIAQLCANYEMKGETSQRIAGISGLPVDPNAGTYNLDFGKFFIDGSLQQKRLSEISNQNNSIKNNPSAASQGVATTMYKDATLHFAFGEGDMSMDVDQYDTANFFYGMIMMVNQSIFDLKPSFEYDGATFNDYNLFIEHLNQVDGPLNMLGRSIEKNMDEKVLKLTN